MISVSACAFLRSHGFIISEVLFDGRIHRAARETKISSKSGWYLAWLKPIPLVVCGDWRTGEKWQWSERGDMTSAERKKMQRAINAAIQEAEVEREAKRKLAAIKAQMLINSSGSDLTEYQKRKGIWQMFNARSLDGDLLIPMQDWKGQVLGLQTIKPNGFKTFLPGQRAAGLFHVVNFLSDHKVIICEGYATGVSIHVSTDASVVCSFSAGNLGPTASAVRLIMPNAELIIAGDNDHKTSGNPGVTEATAVAQVFGARIATPECQGTDFNDMAKEKGFDAVAKAIDKAWRKTSLGVDKHLIGQRYSHWMGVAKR